MQCRDLVVKVFAALIEPAPASLHDFFRDGFADGDPRGSLRGQVSGQFQEIQCAARIAVRRKNYELQCIVVDRDRATSSIPTGRKTGRRLSKRIGPECPEEKIQERLRGLAPTGWILMWLFHNCIAHPLLGLFPRWRWATWLHDVTAPESDR